MIHTFIRRKIEKYNIIKKFEIYFLIKIISSANFLRNTNIIISWSFEALISVYFKKYLVLKPLTLDFNVLKCQLVKKIKIQRFFYLFFS